MGDYGCIGAKGKDGTTLTHRGGGIVRIRPDGTGLELVVATAAQHLRRGRLAHARPFHPRQHQRRRRLERAPQPSIPPGAHMGYPTLFMNFPEDHLQPLADYGGGSPCGALWLDEPGLPKRPLHRRVGPQRDHAPHAESERRRLGTRRPRAPARRSGSSSCARPTWTWTRAAALYITSWEGATFNYNGPNAGYVLRVVKKDAPKVEVPDLGKATPEQLVAQLHREQRGSSPGRAARAAAAGRMLATRSRFARKRWPTTKSPRQRQPQPRFTWAQLCRPSDDRRSSYDQLHEAPTDTEIAVAAHEQVLEKAKLSQLSDIRPIARCAGGHSSARPRRRDRCVDADPRVRAAAITALRRLGKADAAPNILPLVADADPVISHLAVRALSRVEGRRRSASPRSIPPTRK